jgi:excisionase family DNA binding protein
MSTEAEILTPARKLSRPRITPAEKAARSSNSQSSAMPQDHRCLCPLLSRAGDTESWRPVFLTVTETATKLSQHRSAVLRLIHTGQMHSVRLGRTYRIPEANVHSLLAGKPDNRAYLTVEECACILRCSRGTIYGLLHHGHLAGEISREHDQYQILAVEFQRFLVNVLR